MTIKAPNGFKLYSHGLPLLALALAAVVGGLLWQQSRASASPDALIFIDPDPASIASVGAQTTVTLTADDLPAAGDTTALAAWAIQIDYDDSVITALSCTDVSGALIGACNPAVDADTVSAGGAASPTLGDGDGVGGTSVSLTDFTFECVAPGTSALTITLKTAGFRDLGPALGGSGDIPHTIDNGEITCAGSAATAAPTPTPKPSPGPTDTTTELSDTVGAEDTVIVVQDSSGFEPGTIITIDDERVRVLSVSGNEITVERGVEATEATDHQAGSVIAAESPATTTPAPSPTSTATSVTEDSEATDDDDTNWILWIVIYALIGAGAATAILGAIAIARWWYLRRQAW